jgi:hypothetical protein
VSWILPGPLEGRGLESGADLARPDLIVAVDGRPMRAADFKAYVIAAAPGTPLRLAYRRSLARGAGIPDSLNHEDTLREMTVTLASRDEWTGTVERGRSLDTEVTFTGPALLDPFDRRNVLGAPVSEHTLATPLHTLLGVFRTWQDDAPDFHSLSRVRAPFALPFRLGDVAELVVRPTADLPSRPFDAALVLTGENLDLRSGARGRAVAPDAPGAPPRAGAVPPQAAAAIASMHRDAAAALGPLWGDAAFARRALELLRVPRRTFYIEGPQSRDHIAVIRASMGVDFDLLLRGLDAARHLHALAGEAIASASPPAPPPAAPPELAGAVDGEILAAERLGPDLGWLVVGGAGPNRYDMSRIAAVLDPGGDDEYASSDLCLGVRAVVDLAGDDRYSGTDDQGPGSALLGLSFIDDRAGNDRYQGRLLSCGAACFGMSLLLDRDGEDSYIGGEWSIGAACYGAGVIIDAGGASDVYLGEFLCQGIGGPRGFGCIVDQGGRDLYRVNGPEPSVYGTAAVYSAFSQAVGFGFRNFAAGGVGLISDLGGDDRYEGGEFAQGGAYYFGLGVLHDAAGRDLYYANRYAQGFGVHQAHGVLLDGGGDDTYWSMTAASQGSGWDIGAGLLLDRDGDDSYQCDGLGQGGASQQAIGMLVDLAGSDRYVAAGGATQGRSGGNGYHHARTGAFSFSLLLDLGGATDLYSSGRSNDAVTAHGAPNPTNPAESELHGLSIDR